MAITISREILFIQFRKVEITPTHVFGLLSVNIFSVPNFHDKNHEPVVVYFVNHPIVSDPDSVELLIG